MGIYIYALQYGREGVKKRIALFTDASIDFSGIVKPGEMVTVSARKMFFRRHKLRSEATMALDDGTVVCAGTISGFGVER